GTVGQGARPGEREQYPLKRGTVGRPTGPGGAAGAAGDKDAMKRGVGGGATPEVAAPSLPVLPERRDLVRLLSIQARQRRASEPDENAMKRGDGGGGGLGDGAVPRRMAGSSPAMTKCQGVGQDPNAEPATGHLSYGSPTSAE